MVTIKITTTSPKAVEYAKKLMASKKETEKEIRAYRKTPEYKAMLEDLQKINNVILKNEQKL